MARSGISYAGPLEWRFAAQWAGYRYEDFERLPGERQSAHVAAFRAHQQIEGVLVTEQMRQQQAQAAQARNAGKGGRRG